MTAIAEAPNLEEPQSQDEGFVLRINGREYDVYDLDLNEVEEIEDMCGTTMDELNWRSAKSLKAVSYVFIKRDNPTITPHDAVSGVRFVGIHGD